MSTKEKVFTPAQREVIDSRRENLLVSASAGSGKTSTMIERIAGIISDGVPVRDILALTFTKAAAAEMREKLWNKLLEKSAEPFIREQLAEFPLCGIGTIDSFCGELLRGNFAAAGLDPSFSIIEGMAEKMLFAEALDETLGSYYEENSAEFFSLADAFGKRRRDTGLKTIITEVYKCAVKIPDPQKWLAAVPDFYGEKYTAQTLSRINAHYVRGAEFFRGQLREQLILCRERQMTAHIDALERIYGQIDGIEESKTFEHNYNLILAFCAENLPPKKTGYDEELVGRIKSTKNALVKFIEKSACEFGGRNYEKLLKERSESADNARLLAEITRKLIDNYAKKKQTAGALDFSDLEQLADKLLSDETLAAEMRKKYRYIFVDEYQDVNGLQESILRKLAGKDNRFMVGDIKQSIYAFRHSDPEIIKARMSEFADGQAGTRKNLSRNFRSRPEILDFVNFIFENIMTDGFGGADYKNEHMLEYPACAESEGGCRVSLDIISGCKRDYSRWDDSFPMPYDINAACAEEKMTNAEAEALVIAAKIKGLIEKGFSYEDIVILSRSQSNHAFGIYKKLQSLGIPVSFPPEKIPDAGAELDTLLNFMSVINNPLQDIPLAAALSGFLYGFSSEELAAVRLAPTDSNEPDFFDRLTAYSKTEEGEKAALFLGELARYRQLSKSLDAAELLTVIINEKAAENYILSRSGGAVRAAALYNFISAIKGNAAAASLPKFCSFIELYGKEKVSGNEGTTGCVRMNSVHASKGLEYPAVILAGLGTDEQRDSGEAIVDKDSGISVNFYDAATRTKNCTLNKAAAKIAARRRRAEESLRILYVALTRAKEYLCLTGCLNKLPAPDPAALEPFALLNSSDNFLDLITAVVANRGAKGFDFTVIDKSELEKQRDSTPARKPVFPLKDEKAINAIKEKMEFCYPFEAAKTLEFKMAAGTAAKILWPPSPMAKSASNGGETAETGILYHKILDSIDFGAADISKEIERMTKVGILTESEAVSVDTALIQKLLGLDILRRAAAAPAFREQPFMMLVPASELDSRQSEGDAVIIQGIVDLMFFEGENTVIVDYKYSALSAEELKNSYTGQLNMYARAAEKVIGKPVSGKYIVNIKKAEVITI